MEEQHVLIRITQIQDDLKVTWAYGGDFFAPYFVNRQALERVAKEDP